MELVHAAAALFVRGLNPERRIVVSKQRHEWFTTNESGELTLTEVGKMAKQLGFLKAHIDRVHDEGPQWRIEVSPGGLKVASTDPIKRDRARARAATATMTKTRIDWEREQHEPCWNRCSRPSCVGCRRQETYRPEAKIMGWSTKSRTAMRRTLGTLDYAPLYVNFYGKATKPAMVTLTYPGDWEAVAPSNAVVVRHVDLLRKRWDRMFTGLGFPLVGVWKREFQRRGAPHYHLLCVPPEVPWFREWLSETWAEIVGAQWCGTECWKSRSGSRAEFCCCERGRHVVAGTGVDFREGAKGTDPARLAVYFAKHGSYSAKEYQNEGPALWKDNGGVGRFWGRWGLDTSVAAVAISPEAGLAIGRTLRRLEHTRRWAQPVRLLRCVRTEWDPNTGEQIHTHTRGCFRNSTVVAQRFPGSRGYVLTNDGPALASALSRVAEAVDRPERGYVGFWSSATPSIEVRWWNATGRRKGFLP